MSRVKEIDTGRKHQIKAYRQARKILRQRNGGIVLGDGVGLGKTYEALATVATLLAQGQQMKQRKRKRPFRILILVPPNLVTKWANELELDNFLRYMKDWENKPTTRAVYKTFADEVVVLRRFADLKDKKGEKRRYHNILPAGLYISNFNLLFKSGQKGTQIHRTPWDAVIVDEAHRIAGCLTEDKPHSLIAGRNTKTLLLTATPFQLSPVDLKGILQDTFGGFGNPLKWEEARRGALAIYNTDEFKEYRKNLNSYFRKRDLEALRRAAHYREKVSADLRDRMIRNPKRDQRKYFFVDSQGNPQPIKGHFFDLDDLGLTKVLDSNTLVKMEGQNVDFYLDVRNRLAEACSRGVKPFVAAALRQLLSTYEQFKASEFAKYTKMKSMPKNGHPKLGALINLIVRIFGLQLKRNIVRRRGWVEKALIFSTYVGAEHSYDFVNDRKRHGTANAIKNSLEAKLRASIQEPDRKLSDKIKENLLRNLRRNRVGLTKQEFMSLERAMRLFAGSRCSGFFLSISSNLEKEKRYLGKQLRKIGGRSRKGDTEKRRRENERRQRRFQNLLDRYSTRGLVARYDGTLKPKDRDRHLRGFNSPYAPLVLIASSVGQEGIDLQRYCTHVIHYDLEWNPAKLEQREGRVDREGRQAKGPVNVYFLICKDTYDERVLHVMVNRLRWHQMLLANRRTLEADPHCTNEAHVPPELLKKVILDLKPRD